jgi:DNA-binding helix-hairpin-helix protein with protein kinase domain
VTALFLSDGGRVELRRELARGGEGAVFEVADPSRVAKVYHRPVSREKARKLRLMAQGGDEDLAKWVAWPTATLHRAKGDDPAGFLMPRVTGKKPVHTVYSPAHRRQERPKAAWDLLLYVARNTAAAFESVHRHGHVIGDVNQDSILVGDDARVSIIDSDSFQVAYGAERFLCEVGVPHFTPPELQALKSFSGLTRTANHDNFGLALLLFHLLFGGRHPFAGVPVAAGAAEALETDIKAFRFAHAPDARARGLIAPPRSIPMSLVPPGVSGMFMAAFTEPGASNRPSAAQWRAALDATLGALKGCPRAPRMHRYPAHLSDCPWCSLEAAGAVYFVDLGTALAPMASGFVLARAWVAIEAIPAPKLSRLPHAGDLSAVGAPLPDGIPPRWAVRGMQLAVIGVALVVAVLFPKSWLLAALAALLGVPIAGRALGGARAREAAVRASALSLAEREYQRLVNAARDAGDRGFAERRAKLRGLRDQHAALDGEEQRQIAKLAGTARERQLAAHLDAHFIDAATVPGLGPARKAALRSFGIETAADVSPRAIAQVKGFGPGLTAAVCAWRDLIEGRFRFDARRAVTPQDEAAARSRAAAQRSAIEAQLATGALDLRRLSAAVTERHAQVVADAERAAKAVAQARADLAAAK